MWETCHIALGVDMTQPECWGGGSHLNTHTLLGSKRPPNALQEPDLTVGPGCIMDPRLPHPQPDRPQYVRPP